MKKLPVKATWKLPALRFSKDKLYELHKLLTPHFPTIKLYSHYYELDKIEEIKEIPYPEIHHFEVSCSGNETKMEILFSRSEATISISDDESPILIGIASQVRTLFSDAKWKHYDFIESRAWFYGIGICLLFGLSMSIGRKGLDWPFFMFIGFISFMLFNLIHLTTRSIIFSNFYVVIKLRDVERKDSFIGKLLDKLTEHLIQWMIGGIIIALIWFKDSILEYFKDILHKF